MNEISLDEYMNNFKTLTLPEKKNLVIEQLKVLASLTNGMCQSLDIDNEIQLNKDVTEVKDGISSEDDFVEAVMVYLISIQDSLCDFDDKLTEDYMNINN